MVMSLSRVLWKFHSKAPTVTASMLGTVLAAGEGYTTIRDSTEARRANEILSAASVFFASGTRPPHDEMIAFIDEHRDRFGVEAICRVLSATERGFITSRGYRGAKTRPPSARALRDVLRLGRVAKGFGDVDARVWGHVA
ncbi:hypothetical protein ACUXGK_001969 [Micrococcus aloeverae]